MGVDSASDRVMVGVAREAEDLFRGSHGPLLDSLLADAADHRIPAIDRADLLARFSRLLTDLRGSIRSARELRPDVLHALQAEHQRLLHDEVLPELREQGLTIVRWDQVTASERKQLRALFREVIYPLATPLVVDSTHPFPRLAGIPLTIGVFVADHGDPTERFACIPLPRRLFRLGLLDGGFVRVSGGRLIGVEMILCALIDGFFRGAGVLEKSTFRVIHDNPSVHSIEDPSFEPPMCSSVCLNVDETMSQRMLELLVRNVEVGGVDRVYRQRAPLALAERVVATPEAHAARLSRRRIGRAKAAANVENTRRVRAGHSRTPPRPDRRPEHASDRAVSAAG